MNLKPETRLALDEIRRSTEPTPVYGLAPDRALELFRQLTEPMFEGAALPKAMLMQLRWYVSELSRLFRTRYGYALSFQLELSLRKWRDYGVEPNTLQFVLTEVCRGVNGRSGDQVTGKPGEEIRTEQGQVKSQSAKGKSQSREHGEDAQSGLAGDCRGQIADCRCEMSGKAQEPERKAQGKSQSEERT